MCLPLPACILNAAVHVSALASQRKLEPPAVPTFAPLLGAMAYGKKIQNRKLDAKSSYAWVASAALDPTGCRQLQARIETANRTQLSAILRALRQDVGFKVLYESPHGNYVFQRLLDRSPPAALEPILEDLQHDFLEMCCHRFGCRVAERILESGSTRWANDFHQHIIDNAAEIATHQFGNYVVQHFLEHSERRRECALAMLPAAKRIFSTKGGYFVVRFATPHCDEEVQSLFDKELACFSDESEAIRPTTRWQ